MKSENRNYARLPPTSKKEEASGTNVLDVEQVKTFDFNGGLFRAVVEDGEPLFVANDVCRVLEYRNPREALSKHCKHVTKRDIPTAGGVQEANVICEPDLYRLVFRSKKAEAEAFADYVYEEVLPSIRKTGQYTAKPQEIPNFAGLLQALNGVEKSKFIIDGHIVTITKAKERKKRLVTPAPNKDTTVTKLAQYLTTHPSGVYAFKDIRTELGITSGKLTGAIYGREDVLPNEWNGIQNAPGFRDAVKVTQEGTRNYLHWNREAYQKAVQA